MYHSYVCFFIICPLLLKMEICWNINSLGILIIHHILWYTTVPTHSCCHVVQMFLIYETASFVFVCNWQLYVMFVGTVTSCRCCTLYIVQQYSRRYLTKIQEYPWQHADNLALYSTTILSYICQVLPGNSYSDGANLTDQKSQGNVTSLYEASQYPFLFLHISVLS